MNYFNLGLQALSIASLFTLGEISSIPAYADDSPLPLAVTSPAQQAQSARDADIAQKVAALLAKMTLEEKIGQLSLFAPGKAITGPSGGPADLLGEIGKGNVGGLFANQTVAKVRKFQKIAVEQTRLHIPLIFGYDAIHGYKTIFPIPLAESCSWDLSSIEKSAQISAKEASASGLNWTFAPMVDIARDPRWGRIAEGAGEDPYLGSEIAQARVHGFQGDNTYNDASHLIACIKHFAGYGAAQAGREYNTTDISERTLREVYLPPFKAAIDAGADSVMSAFNDLDGVPATANRFLLHDVLRTEWGFKGIVVSDFQSINELRMHGIAASDADASRLALHAGVDLDMQGGLYLNYLKQLVDAKEVPVSEIDEAVTRVLTQKFKLGLFDDPYKYCNEQREKDSLFTPDNLQAAYHMATESMVLLKNETQVLPVKTGKNIAVIGPLAKGQRDLLGCWAGQGEASKTESIFDCIARENVGGQTIFAKGCDVDSSDQATFAEAAKAAAQADVVVMVLGESSNMSGEDKSRTSINLPGIQTQLLEEIKKTGKPVAIVLLNGRPLALEQESTIADAILEAWAPGTKGAQAVADVLFGKANPSGKLTVTFPRNIGQVPIYYSEKNTGRPYNPADPLAKFKSVYIDSPNNPLYPFGFGLSYTTFSYSTLHLNKATLIPGNPLTATVTITNTGKYDGAEIAQMYTRQLVGSVTRPVLELKGFQRVELKAGESQEVTFTLKEKDLAFLRGDMTWGTESGNYNLFIGPNSRDLQSADFSLVNGSITVK